MQDYVVALLASGRLQRFSVCFFSAEAEHLSLRRLTRFGKDHLTDRLGHEDMPVL